MDKESFNKYLKDRYYDQMDYYERSSMKNQKKYQRFQWILIVLSALTPVLAALEWEKFDFQIPVIVISALVAILTTGLKTFQYQELWANYRATQEQLKPEIHYYNFNVGPYGAPGLIKKPFLFPGLKPSWIKSTRAGHRQKRSGRTGTSGITPVHRLPMPLPHPQNR